VATFPLTALVLKKTKLGETDLILTLLGSDGALHKAVAKGARKPGSKFGGRAEPATVFEALVAQGKSLDIITDAKTINTHHRIREDYDILLAVSVVLDFAGTVAQEELEDERFFQLTSATLDAFEYLAQHKEEPLDTQRRILVMMVAYLLKGAAMHGYRLDADVSMQPHATEELHQVAAVSDEDPQYRAPDCRDDLLFLLGATLADLHTVDLVRLAPSGDLLAQTRAFLRAVIPARLKALDAYTIP